MLYAYAVLQTDQLYVALLNVSIVSQVGALECFEVNTTVGYPVYFL